MVQDGSDVVVVIFEREEGAIIIMVGGEGNLVEKTS